MANITCPQCSRFVDDSAKFCPGCKYNIKKYVKVVHDEAAELAPFDVCDAGLLVQIDHSEYQVLQGFLVRKTAVCDVLADEVSVGNRGTVIGSILLDNEDLIELGNLQDWISCLHVGSEITRKPVIAQIEIPLRDIPDVHHVEVCNHGAALVLVVFQICPDVLKSLYGIFVQVAKIIVDLLQIGIDLVDLLLVLLNISL